MPQEFYVSRCARCRAFQVQQAKKVNKWECRVCGLKQSLLKEYGRGSAAECRVHVQKLNAMRGKEDELEREARVQSVRSPAFEFSHCDESWSTAGGASANGGFTESAVGGGNEVPAGRVSKWAKYLSQDSGECAQPTSWLKSDLRKGSSSGCSGSGPASSVPRPNPPPLRPHDVDPRGSGASHRAAVSLSPASAGTPARSLVHDLSELADEDDDFDF